MKKHPWFKGVDWQQLLHRGRPAPVLPRLKGKEDTSNFDDYSKLPPVKHEMLLTDADQKLFEGL